MLPSLFVLDASFFVEGADLSALPARGVISPKIRAELERYPPATPVATMLQLGKLTIHEPLPQSVEYVQDRARATGDASVLSDADVEILAVAYELGRDRPAGEVLLFSDDYAIQNVAESAGIPVHRARKAPIREQIQWVVYCPACHVPCPGGRVGDPCPECATPLKRRRARSRRITS